MAMIGLAVLAVVTVSPESGFFVHTRALKVMMFAAYVPNPAIRPLVFSATPLRFTSLVTPTNQVPHIAASAKKLTPALSICTLYFVKLMLCVAPSALPAFSDSKSSPSFSAPPASSSFPTLSFSRALLAPVAGFPGRRLSIAGLPSANSITDVAGPPIFVASLIVTPLPVVSLMHLSFWWRS